MSLYVSLYVSLHVSLHVSLYVSLRRYTWIDFPKFLELFHSGKPFSSADYMVKTPEWAVFGRGLPGDGG